MLVRQLVKIPLKIGEMSCVGGILGPYPMPRGNHFSFAEGPPCVNMWAENLEELVRRGELQGDLEIEIFYHDHAPEVRLCRVVDSRVPSSWLNSSLCFRGSDLYRLSDVDRETFINELIV